jgi:hypothetical protein
VNISVVTTFNQAGYELYGQRMIDSFLRNWPSSVQLYVFAENIAIPVKAENLHVLDLHTAAPDLVKFKNTWKNVPHAHGDIKNHPVGRGRQDNTKSFKWDAVRFSNKVYAVHACSEIVASDWLLWMDADMICHSEIRPEQLFKLLPASADICFLGRGETYTECGLYALNLNSQSTKKFLSEFKRYYDEADVGIFTLAEWHDSFVFDHVRSQIQLAELDWSREIRVYTGHPLINSAWGAYLDHLKGDRKIQGKSSESDLRVTRTESYWK